MGQDALCFRMSPLVLLPRYFSVRRRLQNDKFSTLKKDFRCLRGTFCAALSFRLLFTSLVLYLPSPAPFFPLSYSPSPFLSFLTYLLSFLARSLHPSSLALTFVRRSRRYASPSASFLQIYNALACNKRLRASFTIMSSLQVPRGLIELRPFRSAVGRNVRDVSK